MNHSEAILPRERTYGALLSSRRFFVALLGVVAVIATAAATVRSPQLGCAVALVLSVVTMYAASPAAGVAALTLMWLVAPGIRRVLGLEVGYLEEDPLSLAPFLATAAIAAMAAWRSRPSRAVFAVSAAVGAGLLFGVPAGMADPNALGFALTAYGGALSALFIGSSEAHLPLHRWTMLRVLWLAAPILALYALYQYFIELPTWDQAWLDTVEFTSIGAPEEGKIRAFSSLNGPGTLAVALALAVLVHAGLRGPLIGLSPTLVLVAAGLSVTYVRSAWLAVVVGALALLLASRGRAAPQLGALALLLALAMLALSASGSTFTAFLGRVETFGALGQDESVQARTALPAEVLPQLMSEPLGYGLGSAGEATRLSPRAGLAAPDNGYLAMAFQLGLLGAALVVAALLAAMAVAVRRMFARGDPDRAVVTAVFAFFMVSLAAGDQFYGVAGVLLWYSVGAALGRSPAP